MLSVFKTFVLSKLSGRLRQVLLYEGKMQNRYLTCLCFKYRAHSYVTTSSTHLNMKFILLMNVKMPTIVGILPFMIRKIIILKYLSSQEQLISCSVELSQ